LGALGPRADMPCNIDLACIIIIIIIIYHILGCDYAEFARRDIGDVKITHISTPCKKCISISAHLQKMHISDVTLKKYVTANKSVDKYLRILSSFTTAILA
jgi:hypothetical protein